MSIQVAAHAGFCEGVKRAIEMAKSAGEDGKNVVTLGPIVHNLHVVEYLKDNGVQSIDESYDITKLNKKTVVVLRSHGVSKEIYQKLEDNGNKVIDATCPFVKLVHKKAYQATEVGNNVVVVGDPTHPEVIGIMGWTNGLGYVVDKIEDIDMLPNFLQRIEVVGQTTLTKEKWEAITTAIKNKYSDAVFHNTICKATSIRQKAAINTAKEVDVMLVVGCYSSSNTKKLVTVCQKQAVKTYQIEQAQDINVSWFAGVKKVGITAGASTPDWVIKEVVQLTEELMNEEVLVNEVVLAEGDVVKAKIIKIEEKVVVVDVGYKYDGIIPIGELSNLHIETADEVVSVDDELELEVIRIDDEKSKLVLSKRRLDAKNSADKIKQLYETQEAIEVVVADVVKGGLVVDLGVRAFIPASHIENHFVEDFSDYKGKTITVKVIEFDEEKNKVILSQKVVQEEQENKLKADKIKNIKIGSVIEGTVQRITDFGVFVDIGGVDGLAHVSELAWQRVEHPSELVNIGDTVKVKVIDVNLEKERIGLSIRAAAPSPWDDIENNYTVGDVCEGTVKRIVSFGAFVELTPGVEGLVHISEVSEEHIGSVSDVLKVAQKVKVKILEINSAEKRISLSIKQTMESSKKQENSDLANYNYEPSTFNLGDIFAEKLGKIKK